MEYYDPIDHTSKRYALVITIAVLALCVVAVSFITVDIHPPQAQRYEVVVELIDEEPVEQEKPKEPVRKPTTTPNVNRSKAPSHVEQAVEEQSQQNSGEAEQNTTINPNSLFTSVVGNTAEQVTAGNRLSKEDEKNQSTGDDMGYNLIGDADIDAGSLSYRVSGEGLTRPKTKSGEEGTVVVEVEVDKDGNVVTAVVTQGGSTTNDEELRRAAVKAALATKFKPSSKMSEGGKITYVFKAK